ncbi:MAG TPA: hypothetical protein VEB43_06890 [Anaeromyxobacter sp.]|nr:hypothetical protein [Anaeromyxobacter sp.]
MAENAQRLAGKALHHGWIERRPGEGKGLLAAIARHACAVAADDYPAFFLPRMGPERPIFGTVRFMSSERARKRLKLHRHLARFGGGGGQLGSPLDGACV